MPQGSICLIIIGAVLVLGAVAGFISNNQFITYASIPIAILSGAIYIRAKT